MKLREIIQYRVFYGALVVSMVLHAVVLLTSTYLGFACHGEAADAHLSKISVSLRALAAPEIIRQNLLSASGKSEAKLQDHYHSEMKAEAQVEPVASPIAYDAGSLDENIKALADPVLEPAYGFADDVNGRISLGLLINDSGNVVWVVVENSELDEISTNFIREAFRSTRFSVPMFSGKAASAWYRVEVNLERVNRTIK